MVSIDQILRQRRARTSRPSTRRRQPTRARALGTSRAPSRRPTTRNLPERQRRLLQGTARGQALPAQRPLRTTTRDRGLTAEELAQAAIDAFLDAQGGGGGGGGGLSAADRQAEIRLESRLGAEESARRRTFERQEALRERAARAEEIRQQLEERRQENIRGLRGERQSRFVDLIGRDQARAVLFALGLGPQADIFTTRASQLETTLPALQGARTLELETEAALAQLLGKDIDIGAQGVSGLGPAQGAATAFQRGGLSAQQLLSSAFGVGDLGTGRQPGIGADELRRIVESVTPRGTL